MTSLSTGITSSCVASQTESDWPGVSAPDLPESSLPREFRNRLHKLFERVEREFEREYQKLCAENYARTLTILNNFAFLFHSTIDLI